MGGAGVSKGPVGDGSQLSPSTAFCDTWTERTGSKERGKPGGFPPAWCVCRPFGGGGRKVTNSLQRSDEIVP